ncbi:MAG: META domain-containing protein [Caldilineaceae bacterium]
MFSTKRIFKLMAVLAIFLLPAACIGPQPDADAEAQPAAARTVGGGELVGPVWQLTQIATRDGAIVKPADSVLYTLAFGEDGRVAAQISCNRGTGSYETDGNGLTFGLVASTMAACPPDSVADDFVAGLDDARSYAVDGDTLRITTRTGVMTFTSTAAEEEITEEAPAEATAEPVEETAVTGNVTYMVRMALPDGAVITVRLVDISLADAPSELITEQVITTEAASADPFELAYDPRRSSMPTRTPCRRASRSTDNSPSSPTPSFQ